MHPSTSRLVLALALAFSAGATWAQAAIADGTSNTVATGGAGAGSLTTSASGTLNVTQRAQGTATGGGGQTVAVGSALDAEITRGTLAARGSANGSVTQSRDATSNRVVPQTLTLGSVAGTLNAAQVSAEGVLQGSLTQRSRRGTQAAAGAGQSVDIGSVSDASGGSLVAQGAVLGDKTTLTQDQSGQQQQLRVGSIGGSTLQNGNAGGQLSGDVVQTGNNTRRAGALQAIDVGSIVGTQAATVTTDGLAGGRITQVMDENGGLEQRIAVGSVRNVDGAERIAASGTALGELSQSGRADALVRIGAVEGGASRLVTTQGSFSGSAITQSSRSDGRQRVDIGAAVAVLGQTATQGAVTGRITQSLSTNGARSAAQLTSVGSAEGSRGNVATRALLSGSVTQSSQVGLSSDQQVLVGSVVSTGALTVRTDATVSGDITQTADGVGERQRAIFGGAVGR